MAIKPILFSTPMVQSIKRGEKGATRRAIKQLCDAAPERSDGLPQASFKFFVSPITGVVYWGDCDRQVTIDGKILRADYKRDDVLWVRETWCELPVLPDGSSSGGRTHIYYKADGDLRPEGWREKWRPSIFMPKEAARIFLRVTDVRVERLQDIGEEDAAKEGFYKGWRLTEKSTPALSAKQGFMWIWNMLRKKADLPTCGWAANPWVLVIEFEPCEKPCGF